jgi:tetratricopeptide (TPR) repeat protein
MRLRISCLGLAIGAILLSATLARAENEGQEDLDSATEKKLAADSITDLNDVINLCESALQKGLDATNKQFANNMLTGTLMQRAALNLRTVVERPGTRGQQRNNALTDLDKVLKIDPKMTQAYLMKAQVYIKGNPPQPAEALKAAEQALEVANDQPEEEVQALQIVALLTDNVAKKVDALERGLKIAPNNGGLLLEHGKYMLIKKEFDKALADADAGIKNDPTVPEFRILRGFALLGKNQPDVAAEAFGDAIPLAPDSPVPYEHRARAYAIQKKNEKALEDIAHALEIDPDYLQAILLRAQVHEQQGDLAAAKADVDEALKDRPGSDRADRQAAVATALGMRGFLSIGTGDYSDAIGDFEKLAKIAPKNKQLLVQLGLLYALNKQPRKAVERYTDALAIEPADFLALRGRADSNLNIGKHAEAVTDYEAALKLKPEDSGVLNNLAWVLATSPEDSVRDGKRAIELGAKAAELTDNKQSHILSTLAAGYAESGNFDKAREWSQKAVDLGNDDAETATQLKKELESYQANKPWREKQIIEENESGETAKPKTPTGTAVKHESAAAPDKDTSAKKDPPTRTE